MSEWIKLSDRFPENNQDCLCVSEFMGHKLRSIHTFKTKFRSWKDMKYKHNKFWDYDSENGWYDCSGVTHWIPLPDLPSE